MQREYPSDFRKCMWIITLNAVFAGGSPILWDHLIGAVVPNFQRMEDQTQVCLVDLIVFASLLVGGQSLYVYATYMLNISKMDGAGFVPLFQKQLARHISRLPQSVLDVCNESELMAMMEKDVTALNDGNVVHNAHARELLATTCCLASCSPPLAASLARSGSGGGGRGGKGCALGELAISQTRMPANAVHKCMRA